MRGNPNDAPALGERHQGAQIYPRTSEAAKRLASVWHTLKVGRKEAR